MVADNFDTNRDKYDGWKLLDGAYVSINHLREWHSKNMSILCRVHYLFISYNDIFLYVAEISFDN